MMANLSSNNLRRRNRNWGVWTMRPECGRPEVSRIGTKMTEIDPIDKSNM